MRRNLRREISLLWKRAQALSFKFVRLLPAVALVIAVVGLELGRWKPIVHADWALWDAFMREDGGAKADPRLAFVAVDNGSLDVDLAYLRKDMTDALPADVKAVERMSEEWPWSRGVFARAAEKMLENGARMVALDVEMPETGPGDEELAAVMARFPGRVIIAAAMRRDDKVRGDAWRFTPPADSVMPDRIESDPRIGLVNVWPDDDKVVRHMRYRLNIGKLNDYKPGLWADFPSETAMFARMAEALGATIPGDFEEHRFRYVPDAVDKEFRARSLLHLFVPRDWDATYSDGQFFRDKVVIIGSSAEREKDFFPTPLVDVMPGPEVHLHMANALLGGHFISEPRVLERIGLIVLAGIIGWTPRRWIRRPIIQLLLLILLAVAWMQCGQIIFSRLDFALPILLPMMAMLLVGIEGLAGALAVEVNVSNRIRGAFERYVGARVVGELLNQPEDYLRALGGETREVTILFSDLRNFTKATASLDAHALVTQLNEYFTEMVHCVFRYEGTLDKFMGDAVMAVWGNVRSESAADDARRAALCAVAMRDAAVKLNARWREQGRVEFDLGIALNHGPVVVGNIGAPSRMDFTVIGDAVNNAWRLQEQTKAHPGSILISQSVADLIAPDIKTEPVGEISLAGGALRYHRIAVEPSAGSGASSV